ncbi:MAG: hypothetical protein K6G18_08375 [Treponema sp.]|nr:hypothetical protein [Treponema sp.]
MTKKVIESVEFELHGKQYEARKYLPGENAKRPYYDIVYKGTEENPERMMLPIARDFLNTQGIKTEKNENTHCTVRKIIEMRRKGK